MMHSECELDGQEAAHYCCLLGRLPYLQPLLEPALLVSGHTERRLQMLYQGWQKAELATQLEMERQSRTRWHRVLVPFWAQELSRLESHCGSDSSTPCAVGCLAQEKRCFCRVDRRCALESFLMMWSRAISLQQTVG